MLHSILTWIVDIVQWAFAGALSGTIAPFLGLLTYPEKKDRQFYSYLPMFTVPAFAIISVIACVLVQLAVKYVCMWMSYAPISACAWRRRAQCVLTRCGLFVWIDCHRDLVDRFWILCLVNLLLTCYFVMINIPTLIVWAMMGCKDRGMASPI